MMEGWCVLRCRGRSTLRLAETLAADGYDVWTPIETRVIRIPRANVRRTVTLPIMASYVFARAGHLIDLLGLANEDHSAFSVMHCFGKLPIISDAQLDRLRMLEAKLTPRKRAEQRLPIGSNVKVGTGSFGGMRGSVQRSDTAYTLVCFSDKYVVKIATSLLMQDDIDSYHSAAREAA